MVAKLENYADTQEKVPIDPIIEEICNMSEFKEKPPTDKYDKLSWEEYIRRVDGKTFKKMKDLVYSKSD